MACALHPSMSSNRAYYKDMHAVLAMAACIRQTVYVEKRLYSSNVDEEQNRPSSLDATQVLQSSWPIPVPKSAQAGEIFGFSPASCRCS